MLWTSAILPPCVVVHGIDHARTAMASGLPVTLLSAPGAAVFAGCLWWREIVALAHHSWPDTPAADVLDCGDAPGRAMAALRIGQRLLVLAPCPAWPAVAAAAAALGARVLESRPPGLDIADRRAATRLAGVAA